MFERFADPAQITGYHAHLYYAPETRPVAERLRATIAARFPEARIGNWHDEPVGPHPVAMYQIAFAVGDFPGWCLG
jgi:aromatic ring-cleaving dioxygenase